MSERNGCGIRLSALADGEMSAAERDVAETHVATCAACAAELRRIRAVGRMIRAAAAEVPAGAMARWHEAAERAAEGARLRRLERIAGGLGAIAACLAIVGAVASFTAPVGKAPAMAGEGGSLSASAVASAVPAVPAGDDMPVVADEFAGSRESTADWMIASLSGAQAGGTANER